VYTKILVPLDGSKPAEAILPHVRFLAAKLKLGVELLQVLDPDVVATFCDPEHGHYFDNVEADMRNHSADYLKKLAASFPRPSEALYSVLVGKTVEVILSKAHRGPCALIALATRGSSGIRKWALGSVADKIMRAATNHLLLIHPGQKRSSDEPRLRTVIVPLDGSALAEKVLSPVVELAKRLELEVTLLRAYGLPLGRFSPKRESASLDERRRKLREEAQDYLDGKINSLQAEGLRNVKSLVVEGDAAQEIIDCAKSISESFIAMCTHGRSGLGRWVLGSVTDRVVRNSGDPVLVVHA
jgi:nucleotide-binding universal stress UspA family protein